MEVYILLANDCGEPIILGVFSNIADARLLEVNSMKEFPSTWIETWKVS